MTPHGSHSRSSLVVSPMDMPMVFIVILNWNGIADTLECLASVRKLDYPAARTLVVDNGSHDGSPARLKAECPDIALIEHPYNLGFTGGANAGIQHALAHGADYVWLLNNDSIVEPHSLSALITAAESDEAMGLLSPLIYDLSDERRLLFGGNWAFADLAQLRFAAGPKPPADSPDASAGRPLLLWGTALLIKSSVIRRIGYLDDRYFAYHEDLDYSLRALAAGFRTAIEPEAAVYHKADNFSRLKSPFKMYLFSRNLLLFCSTHLSGLARYTYLPKYVALVIRQAADLRDMNNDAAADACLDGVWNALLRRYGSPANAIHMPALLRHSLSRHPYFWTWLLRGEFRKVLRAVAGRLLRFT